MPDAAAIDDFAQRLHGDLLRPDDAGFDTARRVYNGMIDRHPALIARCADPADVAACVQLAQAQGLPLGIRGGGHNGAGLAVVDDGLVADLSFMDDLAVHPAAHSVRVGPGCTWGDVNRACGEHRLATVSGVISTTGVPGLTLGGGHGYLTRRFGLTVDNLLEAEVVLADGRTVTASPAALHGQQACSIMCCWLGDPDDLDAALAPLRDAVPPAFEHIGPMPYPTLQSLFDGFYPPGLRGQWKCDFVRELPDEAIALHIEHAQRMLTPLSTMHLYPVDGAAHRVAPDATAFGYRDCLWSSMIAGVAERPEDDAAIRDWARGYWAALHPYSAGGAYLNFMEAEGQDRVRAAFRDNYDRLAAVQATDDPDNLLRHNQNIPPAGGGAAG